MADVLLLTRRGDTASNSPSRSKKIIVTQSTESSNSSSFSLGGKGSPVRTRPQSTRMQQLRSVFENQPPVVNQQQTQTQDTFKPVLPNRQATKNLKPRKLFVAARRRNEEPNLVVPSSTNTVEQDRPFSGETFALQVKDPSNESEILVPEAKECPRLERYRKSLEDDSSSPKRIRDDSEDFSKYQAYFPTLPLPKSNSSTPVKQQVPISSSSAAKDEENDNFVIEDCLVEDLQEKEAIRKSLAISSPTVKPKEKKSRPLTMRFNQMFSRLSTKPKETESEKLLKSSSAAANSIIEKPKNHTANTPELSSHTKNRFSMFRPIKNPITRFSPTKQAVKLPPPPPPQMTAPAPPGFQAPSLPINQQKHSSPPKKVRTVRDSFRMFLPRSSDKESFGNGSNKTKQEIPTPPTFKPPAPTISHASNNSNTNTTTTNNNNNNHSSSSTSDKPVYQRQSMRIILGLVPRPPALPSVYKDSISNPNKKKKMFTLNRKKKLVKATEPKIETEQIKLPPSSSSLMLLPTEALAVAVDNSRQNESDGDLVFEQESINVSQMCNEVPYGLDTNIIPEVANLKAYSKIVILENGSGTCMIGFAGEKMPRSEFSSFVGRAKHDVAMKGTTVANPIEDDEDNEAFIGREAQRLRGVLALKYPIEHGLISDWDDMERIWKYAFMNELRVDPKSYPVLITEAPLNPKSHRERIVQTMFDTLGVPAMYVTLEAVLALRAVNKTTGVVLSSGDGVTHAIPVYEGYTIPHAMFRSNVAGRDLTTFMVGLIQQQGSTFETTAEREIARMIKEDVCFVSMDFEKDSQTAKQSTKLDKQFELPDGNVLVFGRERFTCPEALFNPSMIYSDELGVHNILFQAIEASEDPDMKRELYSNIVLAGGTTLLPGFKDRLMNELSLILQKNSRKYKIDICASEKRRYLSWIGGSIMSLEDQYQSTFITSSEWRRYGPAIVRTKCFL